MKPRRQITNILSGEYSMSPQFENDAKNKDADGEWFIPKDIRVQLAQRFEKLDKTVVLAAFAKDGENDPYNDYLIKFVRDLGRLSPKIEAEFHTVGDEASKRHGVTLSPTLLVSPEEYPLRFTGAPMGEEGRALLAAIHHASEGQSGLSKASREALAGLKEERFVRVFTSPT